VTLTLCLAVAVLLALAVVAVVLRIRVVGRREYEAGRAEHKHEVCSFLAEYAQAKGEDGDQHTASALRAAGTLIWHDRIDFDMKALRNETRNKTRENGIST
jgi:lipopolysaccharide export LptBFGC system permease protein LptF